MENKTLNIDKSSWTLTKLGDLLDDISERVDNPAQSGYERFVGLEHFVSGDIKIRNWGATENLTSSAKAFKAGDILFARRNAYLRRASLVDFEGCCSGDAFVLRENHNKVVPGFMAFFFNSNTVWNFANENAAGTMSQRVKWRDLANYEFLLPPKDQQAQLAELLWTMDEVVEREQKALESLMIFKKVKRETLIVNDNFKMIELEDICEKKISYGIVQAGPHIENGMPYIKSSDLSEDGINPNKLQRTSNEIAEKYKRSEVLPGDIVFSLRGNLGAMNFVPKDLTVANLTQGTARLNVKEMFNANYLKHALETQKVQTRIHALSKGSTFKEISLEALRTVRIPIPLNRKEQDKISELLDSIDKSLKFSKLKIFDSQSLQKSLINQIF